MNSPDLKFATAVLVLMMANSTLWAQTNSPNCKDHPFFERIEGYYIDRCREENRPIKLTSGRKKQFEVKGNVTTVSYYGDAKDLPNGYYLLKKYERIVRARGGKRIFWDNGNSGNPPVATFHLVEDGQEYWISLTNFRGVPTEGVMAYDLSVIRVEN